MTAWSALKQFILKPGLAMEDIRSAPRTWISVVLGTIAFCSQTVLWAEVLLPWVRNVYLYLLLGTGIALGYFIVVSAVVNAVSRLLGGKGRYSDFLNVWGYTYIPGILGGLVVVAAISGLTRHPDMLGRLARGQWAPVLIVSGVVVVLVFLLWDVLLKALAIRVVHGISLGRLVLAAIILVVISSLFGSLVRHFAIEPVRFSDLTVFRSIDPSVAELVMAREANIARMLGQRPGQVTTSFEIRKLPWGPRRGDIVVFERPGSKGLSLGRVVALPGETVEVRDGRVMVNGREMPGKHTLMPGVMPGGITIPPLKVPESTYYVLGDNRRLDPASYGGGPVPKREIIGAYFETVLFLQRHGLI
ncbi:MAG TPA: signal peptidase I [Firmicutes bacterium]|nr:signal peptidase I [Bacillota bacterium]